MLDAFLAAAGLSFALPLMAISAIAIRLESPGPVLFRQWRVGQFGRRFQILKLRTMISRAEENGLRVTAAGDSRITAVGKWLRRTKIDELPQLLNVLRGDMSFVGPRPEVPEYVASYNLQQAEILNARPGLTGPASLRFVHEELILKGQPDTESFYLRTLMPLKIDLDMTYCRKVTLSADLKILLLTLKRLFCSPNQFCAEERTLVRPIDPDGDTPLASPPDPAEGGPEHQTEHKAAVSLLKRWSLHPFFRDIGITSATELLILISSMVLVSLFGKLLGPVALGEYLLVRRVASGLQPSSQLGLGVALPRYVARSTVKSAGECETYFIAAFAWLLAGAIGLGAAFYLKQELFARWLLGSEKMAHLMIALALLLLGWAAQIAVYGYFRGRLQMGYANLLQLCSMALLPVAVVLVLYRSHSVAFLLGTMGVLTFACAMLFAVPILTRAATSGLANFFGHSKELLRYGIVRVPGTLAASSFFALGPIIASHYVPMAKVSYFLLGLSILSAVGYCGAPLGVVILSKATMMLAQNRQAEIRRNLAYLVSSVTEISLFVCLQLLVFADVVIHAWVGPKFLEGTVIVQLLIAGIPFYLFIIALRSVVDAVTWKPYNTRNVLLALAIFLALVAIAARFTSGILLLQCLSGALVLALAILAFLTGRVVEDLYSFSLPWKQSFLPIILNLILGGAALLIHLRWGSRIGPLELLLLEACFALVFFGVLAKRGSPWLIRLWNTALPNRLPVRIQTGQTLQDS